MSEDDVFWIRLYLTITATISTAIAAGAVTFQLVGSGANHDVQSLATLIALGCNTALTGMATIRNDHNGSPPPPQSSNHPSSGQG